MKPLARLLSALSCLAAILAIGVAFLIDYSITKFTRRKERNHVAARIARLHARAQN